MSKRLQVLIEDRQMLEIQRFAKRERLTVGEWVRRALREARSQRPASDAETKMQAVRQAAEYAFPIGDFDQILKEIEQGYQGWSSSTRTSRCIWLAQPIRTKTEAQILLERLIAAGRRLVTDVEVLQEILR